MVTEEIREPTPHPFWVAPTREKCLEWVKEKGMDWVNEALQVREHWITCAREDPYSCGVGIRPCNPNGILKHWEHADSLLESHDRLLVSGGNRSGKTMFASKYLVRTMVEKPGARVVSF